MPDSPEFIVCMTGSSPVADRLVGTLIDRKRIVKSVSFPSSHFSSFLEEVIKLTRNLPVNVNVSVFALWECGSDEPLYDFEKDSPDAIPAEFLPTADFELGPLSDIERWLLLIVVRYRGCSANIQITAPPETADFLVVTSNWLVTIGRLRIFPGLLEHRFWDSDDSESIQVLRLYKHSGRRTLALKRHPENNGPLDKSPSIGKFTLFSLYEKHPDYVPPALDEVPIETAPKTRKAIWTERAEGLGSDKGSILWNMPDRMRVNRRERIEIRIGDATVIESQLREGLKGRGVKNIDKLEVARLMRVRLISQEKDFNVNALSTLDQLLRAAEVGLWDFDVTPLRSGQRVLRILVSIRLKVERKDEVVDLPSYEREVRVAVAPLHTAAQFAGKYWQWIATTVAIPLIGWGLAHTDLGASVVRELGIHLR